MNPRQLTDLLNYVLRRPKRGWPAIDPVVVGNWSRRMRVRIEKWCDRELIRSEVIADPRGRTSGRVPGDSVPAVLLELIPFSERRL